MSRTKAQLVEELRGSRATYESLRQRWLYERERVEDLAAVADARGGRVKELEARVSDLEGDLNQAKSDLWIWANSDLPELRLEIDAWRRLAGQLLTANERETQRLERASDERRGA